MFAVIKWTFFSGCKAECNHFIIQYEVTKKGQERNEEIKHFIIQCTNAGRSIQSMSGWSLTRPIRPGSHWSSTGPAQSRSSKQNQARTD